MSLSRHLRHQHDNQHQHLYALIRPFVTGKNLYPAVPCLTTPRTALGMQSHVMVGWAQYWSRRDGTGEQSGNATVMGILQLEYTCNNM